MGHMIKYRAGRSDGFSYHTGQQFCNGSEDYNLFMEKKRVTPKFLCLNMNCSEGVSNVLFDG